MLKNEIDMSFNYEPVIYKQIKDGKLKQINKNTNYYKTSQQAIDKDKSIADTNIRLGKKGSSFCRRYIREDMIVPTITAQTEYIDLKEIAYITKETIRNAQTFPQDFNFVNDSFSNVNFICGMSVPPVMIKRVVTRLIESGVYSYKKG